MRQFCQMIDTSVTTGPPGQDLANTNLASSVVRPVPDHIGTVRVTDTCITMVAHYGLHNVWDADRRRQTRVKD